MAEALAVARQAAAQQRTAAARRRTLSALLTRLLDWCTSSTSAAPVGAGATAAQRPRQGAGEGEGGGGGGAAATAALREWSVQLVLELLCGDEVRRTLAKGALRSAAGLAIAASSLGRCGPSRTESMSPKHPFRTDCAFFV